MIEPTQKRLTIVFTVVIAIFHVLILLLSFFYLHYSLTSSLKLHIDNDIHKEFIPHLREMSVTRIQELREEEYFQVFGPDGRFIAGTRDSYQYDAPVNNALLTEAFAGRQIFAKERHKDIDYLVAYFPIDATMAGRVAMPLTTLVEYEHNFMRLVLICLPFTLLGSFLVSRYLVKQAMKPIHDVFTFQENFSSNVSHELRSPLASLKGNMEVALRKVRSAEDYRKALSLGLHEVDRIIGLLNNLYMLASSKFRPLELLCETTDVKHLMEDVIQKQTSMEPERKLSIAVDTNDCFDVVCDETLIRRAIENLIDNAMKYSPAGGEISIRMRKSADAVVIGITNDCLPITAAETADFFQPFYRGQSARNADIEGKGLGLYIARYITRAHGGDIIVRFTDEKTFYLEMTLPIKG